MVGILRNESELIGFKVQVSTLRKKGYKRKELIDVYEPLLTDKKELHPLFDNIRIGSTVFITNLYVVEVNAQMLLLFFEKLKERGIHLVSIQDDIDTRNGSGELFLRRLKMILDLSHTLLKRKQKEGIEKAREDEKYKGRSALYTEDHPELKTALSLFEKSNLTVKEISNITGISKTTIYDKAKKFDIKREKTKKN